MTGNFVQKIWKVGEKIKFSFKTFSEKWKKYGFCGEGGVNRSK